MTTLNRDWADVLRAFRPNAVTDVTGFGLLGHAYEMADRSGVRLVLEASELAGARRRARGRARRREDRRRPPEPRVRRRARARRRRPRRSCSTLGYDPQTAGGLLVSLPAEQGRRRSRPSSTPADLFVRRIGRVEDGRRRVVADAV